MYVVVCFLAREDQNSLWQLYLDPHMGRFRFQIDLGLALMEEGIRVDWEDTDDPAMQPAWMRQHQLFPCSCLRCFFCKKEREQQNSDEEASATSSRNSNHGPRRVPHGHDHRRQFIGKSMTCRMCYGRLRRAGVEPLEARSKRRRTDKGCRECGNGGYRVCETCWPRFTHQPK